MKKVVVFLVFILTTCFSFSIKISEVYFDSYDEYLWIYNETDDYFSWQIIISWAKSSNFDINLQIPPKTELIIWDDDIEKYFSWYKPFTTWLTLSISDTSTINVDILDTSWQALDTFRVSKELVKKYNNKNTAFEKIFYDTWEVIQAVTSWVNNADWYLVNPWFVQDFTTSENTNTEEDTQNSSMQYTPILCKVWYNLSWDIYNFYFTGNFIPQKVSWYINQIFVDNIDRLSTWINQNSEITAVWYWSWFTCTGSMVVIDNTKNIFTWSLKITEIHPKVDNFPEYIELQAIWNFSGYVIFSWLGRAGTTWQTHILLYSWNYLVIAKNLSWFQTSNVKIYPSMSLLDAGEKLQILSETWQILFEVNYPEIDKNQSYYTQTHQTNIPTPGFWLDFLKYYKIQKEQENTPSCKIILQSQEINSENKLKINFDSQVSNSDFCSNDYKQIWTYSGQVLASWTCNPNYFYLSTWTWIITFQIQDLSGNAICSDTYNYIYEQQTVTQTLTNTKYLDPTPYNCKNLSSHDLETLTKLVKEKYSQTTLKKIYKPIWYLFTWNLTSRQLRQIVEQTMSRYSERTLKYIFNPTKKLFFNNLTNPKDTNTKPNLENLTWKQYVTWFNLTWINLKIIRLLPNPKWKDTNEIIVLSWEFLSWVKLFNWSKYYHLTNPIYSGNYIIFSWSLWLKNKASCVSLYYKQNLLDKKCYTKPKIGQFITHFTNKLTNTQNINLAFSWDKIIINQQQFSNKAILKERKEFEKKLKKIITEIKKILKNYDKKISKYEKATKKLNKLYVKLLVEKIKYYAKYKSYQQKYKTLKEKYSKLYKEKSSKSKQYKNDIKNLKNQIRYLKSVISAIKKDINKEDYQRYLKLYNQVKKWYKIKFSR